MISWPDREPDTTTSVHWLQGSRSYVDLRQPAQGPDFSRVRSLADLSWSDCIWLARQQGFAGELHFDGTYFEWHRHIDFQPRSLEADAGSLTWNGNVLVEKGRDSEYVEHWHREPSSASLPVFALTLREADRETKATLLRVGPVFMYARERTVPLKGRVLSECVSAAQSLEEARELVNCEISLGAATTSGFRITASTLPYRVGDLLDPRFDGRSMTISDRAPDAATWQRRWEIVAAEGDWAAAAR